MSLTKQLFGHFQNCREIRSLLKDYKGQHLHSLYWYDMPLSYAISWRGVFKIAIWRLSSNELDPVAANYGINSLYFKDVGAKSQCDSGASVWQCKSLDNTPWPSIDVRNISKPLKEHSQAIIEEFQRYKQKMGIHPDSDSLAKSGRWDGMFLYGVEGRAKEDLLDAFSNTFKILDEFPLCTTFGFVAFSSIEPKTHIAAHVGSSNLRLRYHLGIYIPEEDAARIRVADEWHPWRQGEVIFFDDSFNHEVIHNGEKPRIVLIVDIWHPSLTPEDIEILSHPVFSRFGK